MDFAELSLGKATNTMAAAAYIDTNKAAAAACHSAAGAGGNDHLGTLRARAQALVAAADLARSVLAGKTEALQAAQAKSASLADIAAAQAGKELAKYCEADAADCARTEADTAQLQAATDRAKAEANASKATVAAQAAAAQAQADIDAGGIMPGPARNQSHVDIEKPKAEAAAHSAFAQAVADAAAPARARPVAEAEAHVALAQAEAKSQQAKAQAAHEPRKPTRPVPTWDSDEPPYEAMSMVKITAMQGELRKDFQKRLLAGFGQLRSNGSTLVASSTFHELSRTRCLSLIHI